MAGDRGRERRQPNATSVRGRHRLHPQPRGAHAEAIKAEIHGGDKEHHRAPRHHSQPLYLPLQIEQGTAGEQLVALVSESSRRTQRPM